MENSSRASKEGSFRVSAVDCLALSEKLSQTSSENSNTNLREGTKCRHGAAKASVSFEDKIKVESDVAVTELLGSVTTQNCPGVRTSARVIQKMKQDQSRPTTPPPTDRDHKHKDERQMQKTPSQARANRAIWSNIEKNHFFDALNEFGKDFEAIGNYINSKLKRKYGTDASFKTKDQVRQHYYQTFHKICKYIRFSEEVKKPAQEMYALINYGEMRRKLQFISDKHFFKLKNLVYQGQIIVRCKGKNIRVKTPSCKALRRLNQLDESLEDIRLPSKIEVIVSPANMEAFGRVQTIAQNPRARVTVPLQKKLINFIRNFQHKWRSPQMKYAEEATRLFPTPVGAFNGATSESHTAEGHQHESKAPLSGLYHDPEMCFLPKPGVTIHRPLLSITEYLSSVNICLSAYEERMGVKVRGENLCLERPNNKRQRTESGSDKRSPDIKKQKQSLQIVDKADPTTTIGESPSANCVKEEPGGMAAEPALMKSENSAIDYNGDTLTEELNELLGDVDVKCKLKTDQTELLTKEESVSSAITFDVATTTLSSTPTVLASTLSTNPHSSNSAVIPHVRSRRATSAKARSALNFKPLISEDVIRRIRRGWTVSNAADITIGDLYVVFGQDSKLELEYFWTTKASSTHVEAEVGCANSVQAETSTVFPQRQNGMPYNPNECDDSHLMKTIADASVSNKIKHLLLIANLSERMRKRQCSCGHTCEKSVKPKIDRNMATKTFISNRTFLPNVAFGEGRTVFRQPVVPLRRPVLNMESLKQLSTVSRQKMSRQVLVQRLLLPSGTSRHEALSSNNLQNLSAEPKEDKVKRPSPVQNSDLRVTSLPGNTSHLKHASQGKMVTSTDLNPMQPTIDHAKSENLDTPDSVSSTATECKESSQGCSGLPETQSVTHQTEQRSAHLIRDFGNLLGPASLPDSAFDEMSNMTVFSNMSPMHLLRDSTSNSRWLEENLNDFSLTSLLGHLDDLNSSRDILDPPSNLSVISESSVDYMSKFQEITALMRSQDND